MDARGRLVRMVMVAVVACCGLAAPADAYVYWSSPGANTSVWVFQ